MKKRHFRNSKSSNCVEESHDSFEPVKIRGAIEGAIRDWTPHMISRST